MIRVDVAPNSEGFVGTYMAPHRLDVAVVTHPRSTEDEAYLAAVRWVVKGEQENEGPPDTRPKYEWKLDPQYPGRWQVINTDLRVGLVRE